MSELNGAYEDALKNLSQTRGPHVAMVVQAVIESKQVLAEFEGAIAPLQIATEIRQILMNTMIEQVTNDVAVMCNLIGKGFKSDILPLVEQVTKEATAPGRHLQ